jgi:hypothetical protein
VKPVTRRSQAAPARENKGPAGIRIHLDLSPGRHGTRRRHEKKWANWLLRTLPTRHCSAS